MTDFLRSWFDAFLTRLFWATAILTMLVFLSRLIFPPTYFV